ncbi:DUF1749-domain-containing protein [Dothidotthia symphoricarpi CBS 119687]|uniref:DUF1749-domain-containing protein n=1 Tax=Dothidotthia symphoricarpi CBS 119687 TaxID=1392245 RepID=A0A6A6A7H8_9PLEO|nr:DUF1749-domain-containing protein [Dothidotthia symphoricarpi CBS 119687]KAF2126757.1 DUF1749-domain-containing protein [Dothidotthia symphoricarpi CBS 119687]
MSHPGTAHIYAPSLLAFEHTPHPSAQPTNTLLFIGGLGDGLLTIPYPRHIAAALPPTWSLCEVLLSSSYTGWGVGSLARDAMELGECVAYFKQRRGGGKVVIMGHSTGCQDIMEYLVGEGKEGRPRVEGVVMQGGVSDREAWGDYVAREGGRGAFDNVVEMARRMVGEGRGGDVMPSRENVVMQELGAPMSAQRTLALLDKGGADDYFSSDLEDGVLEGTFGRIPGETVVCFLLGGEDPYVPRSVDKEALMGRWAEVVRRGGGRVDGVNGGVVEGAHHNLDGDPEEVVQELVRRVCGFLGGLGA